MRLRSSAGSSSSFEEVEGAAFLGRFVAVVDLLCFLRGGARELPGFLEPAMLCTPERVAIV